MWKTAYLEHRIQTATGLELVNMLYKGAIDSVENAKDYLREGDIKQRVQAISKTIEILTELMSSLDMQGGGDLSKRLAALYAYMIRRLTQANFDKSEEPMSEVVSLLTTLSTAWQEMADSQAAADGALRETSEASERGDSTPAYGALCYT
jgi:flagellar protein FliS